MVNLYVNLITKGLWESDNVPDVWQADVEAKLEELKPKPEKEQEEVDVEDE